MTREIKNGLCHRQPNDKNIILPQAGSTNFYGWVTIIVLSLKVNERCCWLSRGSPLRYGWKGTGPPYEKKKEPDELLNICGTTSSAHTQTAHTRGHTIISTSSLSIRPLLIILISETFIVPDITITECNDCFDTPSHGTQFDVAIMHCARKLQ